MHHIYHVASHTFYGYLFMLKFCNILLNSAIASSFIKIYEMCNISFFTVNYCNSMNILCCFISSGSVIYLDKLVQLCMLTNFVHAGLAGSREVLLILESKLYRGP